MALGITFSFSSTATMTASNSFHSETVSADLLINSFFLCTRYIQPTKMALESLLVPRRRPGFSQTLQARQPFNLKRSSDSFMHTPTNDLLLYPTGQF